MRAVLLSTLLTSACLCAQDPIRRQEDSLALLLPDKQVKVGLGIGLDHGGLGGQLAFLPEKHVAFFGALGYAIVGFGWNAGISGRILPGKRVCPTVFGMYGYNAVIRIKGASKYDQIYYGPSMGLGLECRKRWNKNFWWVALVIPFRPDEFEQDMEAIKNNPTIELYSEPLDFAISIAYHFFP